MDAINCVMLRAATFCSSVLITLLQPCSDVTQISYFLGLKLLTSAVMDVLESNFNYC